MKPPKTITAKIVVPEWAKWKTTDPSGQVWVYSHKPYLSAHYWQSVAGMMAKLFITTPPRNWRKTLRRVK